MSIYKDYNGDFIHEKKKYMPSFYVKNKTKLDQLLGIVYWADNYKEAMYCFLNNIQTISQCENCGGQTKFCGAPKYGYYNRFCNSNECISARSKLNSTPEAQEKAKLTYLNKYGVDNPMKLKEIIDKRDQTYIDRYGCHPFKGEARKQTMIELYGAENPYASKIIIEKRKENWIKEYGVDNPMKLEETKIKRKDTWVEKYGEDHPFKTDEVKLKYKDSCMDSLGVDNPFKSDDVWVKIRDVLESRYGVRHNMHCPETCEQANSSNFRDYISNKDITYRIQGYENFAIDILEEANIGFVNSRKDVRTLSYIDDSGVHRKYFPDFKLDNGSYIEVKSSYTFNKSISKMKMVYEQNPDIDLEIWVFDHIGNLINTINRKNFMGNHYEQN